VADAGRADVPRIGLGRFLQAGVGQRRKIGRLVDDVCRHTGFIGIDNHGVDTATIAAAWQAAGDFFDLPIEQKLELIPDQPGSPRGYFALEFEALTRSRGVESPRDPKESFSSGPLMPPDDLPARDDLEFFFGANRWPESLPGFRPAWSACYRAMECLGTRLMRLFAVALELPEDYFAAYHDHHISALRALNYPATALPLKAGQHRAGEHSDYGSVTILKPDPVVGGLELRLPSGHWIAAPPVGDGFLVNIGDLLARWTNDRWVSTLHRVTEPASNHGQLPRRQSIAYFQNPNHDAIIEALPGCVAGGDQPRYAPVTAGQYLIERFRSAL